MQEEKKDKSKYVECIKRTAETYQIPLFYPVYLYYQDELCNNFYEKIDADHITVLTWDYHEMSIVRKENHNHYDEQYIYNHLTTEDRYNEQLEEMLKILK